MISNMASCIVDALIRNKVIDIQSTSVYQYGFEIFISSVLTILITITSGILFHCLTAANESGATRYGNVNFTVINRATGSQVTSAGSSGNVVNYSSITATKGGYSAVTYRFKGNGTLYKGTSQYSGVLWNDSKTY